MHFNRRPCTSKGITCMNTRTWPDIPKKAFVPTPTATREWRLLWKLSGWTSLWHMMQKLEEADYLIELGYQENNKGWFWLEPMGSWTSMQLRPPWSCSIPTTSPHQWLSPEMAKATRKEIKAIPRRALPHQLQLQVHLRLPLKVHQGGRVMVSISTSLVECFKPSMKKQMTHKTDKKKKSMKLLKNKMMMVIKRMLKTVKRSRPRTMSLKSWHRSWLWQQRNWLQSPKAGSTRMHLERALNNERKKPRALHVATRVTGLATPSAKYLVAPVFPKIPRPATMLEVRRPGQQDPRAAISRRTKRCSPSATTLALTMRKKNMIINNMTPLIYVKSFSKQMTYRT